MHSSKKAMRHSHMSCCIVHRYEIHDPRNHNKSSRVLLSLCRFDMFLDSSSLYTTLQAKLLYLSRSMSLSKISESKNWRHSVSGFLHTSQMSVISSPSLL